MSRIRPNNGGKCPYYKGESDGCRIHCDNDYGDKEVNGFGNKNLYLFWREYYCYHEKRCERCYVYKGLTEKYEKREEIKELKAKLWNTET